jgi:hypothetical protein
MRSKPAKAAAGAAATGAGTAVRWSRAVPGIAGAAGIAAGTAMIVHAAVPEIPELAVTAVVAGAFALVLDRRL